MSGDGLWFIRKPEQRRRRGKSKAEGATKAALSRTTTKQSAKIKLSIKIDFCCCFNEFPSHCWPEPERQAKKRVGSEEEEEGDKRRDETRWGRRSSNTISINFKSHITSKQITKELICHQNHASAETETETDVDGDSDCDSDCDCDATTAREDVRERWRLIERAAWCCSVARVRVARRESGAR